jgi:Rad3-related DNA helicase
MTEYLRYFPYSSKYRKPLKNQIEAFEILEKEKGSVTLEIPTGTGKTLIGYVFLKAGQAKGESPLFYIVPNKTLVEQVKLLHPDVKVAYGRNEHPCLYYHGNFRADEVPCSLLVDCPHRVDQQTGETFEVGAEPCPYLLQKFEAKQGGIVVCTMSFFLFTHLFSREFETPARLVVDEGHRIAEVFRNSLSYEITDYHLFRAIDLLNEIGATREANQIKRFADQMIHIIKRRPPRTPTLLEDHELIELINLLAEIDEKGLRDAVSRAVREGRINREEKRDLLKKIEVLIRDLYRYILSFEYSRFTEKRNALNYTYAYYVEDKDMSEGKHVQYRLVIKAYHVAPLIKRLMSPKTLVMSATIGNPEIFKYETGIDFPFYPLKSDFPPENTKIFLPVDVVNLAFNERPRQEPNKTIRRIIKAAKILAKAGHRSLVIVISEAERQKFLRFSQEAGLNAISYGNGSSPKDAAVRFRRGEGEVLIGTASNYAEGVDLPKSLAPVIFFLRPGYPNPQDPGAQFEERRFSFSHVWSLRQWRAMIQALQARGRNIRSRTDIGICFFMSQQFRKFLRASLPAELQRVFYDDKKFDDCLKETIEFLG